LVIDFQGDLRVILLMALTRAPLRAGFGDTGGKHLLTHIGRWNEATSWYRQCVDLLQTLFPDESLPERVEPYNFLLPEDRQNGRKQLERIGLGSSPRPWCGIHPSAGRAIKQWEIAKFADLAERIVQSTSGTVLWTGGPADRELVDEVAGRTKLPDYRLVSGAGVRTFAAGVEQLDLFITGDTGPMHIAQAVGTRNLAIFGPSDPVRYGPEKGGGKRVVVRESLYCSPCNMIRKPPRECSLPVAPECISGISVGRVLEEALRLLQK
jgi:ADP-heptose:LPS heptosyltransferase